VGNLVNNLSSPTPSNLMISMPHSFNIFRFSVFKDLIEKEMSIDKQSLVIIDDKGVDISSMHNDEGALSDKKKQSHV
jgi:hypothetical protein